MSIVRRSSRKYKLKCKHLTSQYNYIQFYTITSIYFFFRGTLEGKQNKPEYDKLLEDPMLKYSGIYQDKCADLMVICQVYDQNEPLALPISTSYKSFTNRWK